jgi:hypothetical protein
MKRSNYERDKNDNTVYHQHAHVRTRLLHHLQEASLCLNILGYA